MFKELADLADELDKLGKDQEADLIDKVLTKLAQDDFDDFFDPQESFPEEEDEETNPFDQPSRFESGGEEGEVVSLPGQEEDDGDVLESHMMSFIMAVADGAYMEMEEAQRDAAGLLKMYDAMTKEEEPALEATEEPEMGQVLEFPGTTEE